MPFLKHLSSRQSLSLLESVKKDIECSQAERGGMRLWAERMQHMGRYLPWPVGQDLFETANTKWTSPPLAECPERFEPAPYIFLFASELENIAGNAVSWAPLETGGECYGLMSHGNRLVIMLCTSPGKDAIHKPAYCKQVLACAVRCEKCLREGYGIQFLGDWHAHPPDFWHPSSMDTAHLVSLAAQNGFRQAIELILTIEKPTESVTGRAQLSTTPSSPRRLTRWLRLLGLGNDPWIKHLRDQDNPSLKVAVRAFLYPNIPSHEFVECSIHVLPGRSPIRIALDASPGNHVEGLDFASLPVPLEQIRYLPRGGTEANSLTQQE